MSNYGMPYKSGLGITHPANLCMICSSLKSTDLTLSPLSMYLSSFTFTQSTLKKLYKIR